MFGFVSTYPFLGQLVNRGLAGVYGLPVVLALFVVCNGGSQESQVFGRVKLDGNPIGPGTVVFAPLDGGRKPATGSIDADGNYSLNTSRESGLGAGKYTVAVSIREMPQYVKRGDRPPLGKLLIPEKYELSTTSGLEYKVEPGSNSIDIELSNR